MPKLLKILEDAYIASSDFAFKRKQGEIRIRQMKNEVRTTKAAFNRQPEDSQLKKKLADITAKLESTELEHYKLCAENYPTDLKLKYEYGRCLIKDRQYDLAIPQFQEAQKDPRYRISAMDRTGLCFFLKGWHSDAADIFRLALDECEVKDSPIAKEIRYNLARSYEADGKMDQAIELYRKLAQLDFGFKDIKDRIENLRRQNT